MSTDKKYRGRKAEKPGDIPGKGWKDVLIRVKDEFSKDHLGIISAGVGFYFFLSLFPMMVAAMAIYGLVVDPAQVEQHMNQLTGVLPEQAHSLIADRLRSLSQGGQTLGWALAFSILVSLWSANAATKALFEGVNVAYDEQDDRGFFKLNAITLAITIGAIIVGFIAAVIVIAFPALVGNLGLPDTVATVISWARWPVLFLIVMFAIGLVYKIGPDRDNPKFKWVSWGAGIATVLWIGASLLFSLYVNNFGDFDATYGSVAAVIILMLWFQITATCVLLGAEINSELEHQTEKDTTVGEPRPMGERQAHHADHVAGEPGDKTGADKRSEEEERENRERIKNRERMERERNIRAKNKERRPGER